MTCHIGEGVTICTGRNGSFVAFAACPCCCLRGDPPVRCLDTPIFSGWCGSDMVCGNCGQEWSTDDDRPMRNTPIEQRDANIALVAATPDPKCWDCHDTGDTNYRHPGVTEPQACSCVAAQPAPGEKGEGGVDGQPNG